MAKKSPKQQKPKTGLARCLELASNKKGLVFLSAILSSLASIASFVPYIAVYFILTTIHNSLFLSNNIRRLLCYLLI